MYSVLWTIGVIIEQLFGSLVPDCSYLFQIVLNRLSAFLVVLDHSRYLDWYI